MEAESEFAGNWGFQKCNRNSGPHGHFAITRRETTGRVGFLFFFWRCVDCGKEGKRYVIRVDKFGCVL